MDDKTETYPEGHFVGVWIGICIVIFSLFGMPFSIATGNAAFIGMGPALGAGVGVAIGQAIENKRKEEGKIRPLTDEEKKRQRTLVTAGLALLVVFAVLALTLFLLRM